MPCAKCSGELDDNSVCSRCFQAAKEGIVKNLEEFVDKNYPANQYKTFNARIKAKFKDIAEEK